MRNVPKLRFKGFSDEWKKKQLGDLCSVITKGTTPKRFEQTGVNFIKIECFNNGRIDKEKCLYISEETNSKELKRSILEERDILFAIAGATIGKCALVDKEILPANTNQALSILRLEDTINEQFVLNILNSNIMKEYINLNISVGAQPNLNLEQMNKFTFRIPDTDEQEKIANFLTKVDKLIEKQDEKVSNLEQYKKGMMQKIFSQEIRFKKDDGGEYPGWNEITIGEVCTINTGKKDTQDREEGGTYPFFVRSQIVERINSYSYDGEAILTAGDGVGVGKVFHYVNCKFDYHQRVYKLSDFNGVTGRFLFEYFSENFKREVAKYNAKTSVDSVRLEMITKMKMPLPCIEEQTKIANLLSKIDSIVEKEKEKLEELRDWKKGLLQGMFV